MSEWVNTGVRMNVDNQDFENFAYFRTTKKSRKQQALEKLLLIYLQNIYCDGVEVKTKELKGRTAKIEITLSGLEFDASEGDDE